MVMKSGSVLQKKIIGSIWIVLALPMIAFPLLNDGNPLITFAGLIFLVCGLAAFRQRRA